MSYVTQCKWDCCRSSAAGWDTGEATLVNTAVFHKAMKYRIELQRQDIPPKRSLFGKQIDVSGDDCIKVDEKNA